MALPMVFLGRQHLTTLTMTLRTVSGTDGALSDSGSARSVIVQVENVRRTSQSNTEQVGPINSRLQNNVIVDSGTTYEIDFFVRYADATSFASATNMLQELADVTDYSKMIMTRGGKTYTFDGLVTGLTEGGGRGSWKGSLTLSMVDPGTANPAIS